MVKKFFKKNITNIILITFVLFAIFSSLTVLINQESIEAIKTEKEVGVFLRAY